MLTRTLKEIWLFGGLETLATDDDGKNRPEGNKATQEMMEGNVRVVEEGVARFIERYETSLEQNGRGEKDG